MRPALLHRKLSSSIQLNLVKVSKEQNQKPEEGVLPFFRAVGHGEAPAQPGV